MRGANPGAGRELFDEQAVLYVYGQKLPGLMTCEQKREGKDQKNRGEREESQAMMETKGLLPPYAPLRCPRCRLLHDRTFWNEGRQLAKA